MNSILADYYAKVKGMSAEGYAKAAEKKDPGIDERLKAALTDAPKGCGAIPGAFRTAELLIESGLVDENQVKELVRVLVVGRCVNASAQDKWLGNSGSPEAANADEV